MSDLIDDQELQRLLDGTLAPEDRAMLLQFAEDHPENWRHISLAFLEEQSLRDQLTRLVQHAPTNTPSPAVEADHGESTGQTFRLFSQAAVLCLLFGTAVWIGRLSMVQEVDGMAENVAQETQEDVADDYTILLTPDEQSTTDNGVQLASMNSDDAVEQMFEPIFDQESQDVFRNFGYTVNEEPVIFVVQGPTGEQFLVPRRNVSFVADNH